MATIHSLAVEKRETKGKSGARSLRREGKVPCIIYGCGEEQMPISASLNELRTTISKGNFKSRVLDIVLDGKPIRVIPREVQLHPVTDVPEHVDFLRLNDDSKVKVSVLIDFLNLDRSPGLKRGGVLNIVRRKLELICSATSIPERLTVDLAGAQIGHTVHFSHIDIPEGTEATITDRDFTIATIVGRTAKTEEEEEAAEEAEEAEAAEGGEEGGEASAEEAKEE